MSNDLPGGVFPACLTPLKKDLSINFSKLNHHCNNLLSQGCDGLVLMGTTGEANSFDQQERKAILESVLESGVEPRKILVGTGCCSLPETKALTEHALRNEVKNVLIMPPFYYGNISDDGLYNYFEQLVSSIDHADLRIYLYHFPKMSGVPFSIEMVEKLIESFGKTIAGIKDSSGDWENMSTLSSRFTELGVFTGNEVFLTDLMNKGGKGTISATVNVSAKLASEVYRNISDQNGEGLQEELTRIRRSFERYPMIPILKLVMSQIDNDDDWLNIRPPLSPLRFWNEDEVNEILESI